MKTDKFQNKYRIPSARAVWHDYNGGDYFITICTAGRLHYFGEISDGEMHYNRLGQELDILIQDIKKHNPYTEVPLYQIMPNHVHLIVCIDDKNATNDKIPDDSRDMACHLMDVDMSYDCRDEACHVSTGDTGKNEKMREIAGHCGLLSTSMGGLKSALTKYANLNKIKFGWQTRFHDHIIRSQEEMNRIASYIENNVMTWENDKFYTP